MTLTIITINYNNAEGLRKTLASVASQTYADIEHVIVDGGSTDGSVEVIREYARANGAHAGSLTNNCHQIHWLSEPDNGIYHAMNKGIEIALGQRIVNDDHTSSPITNSQSPIASTSYIQILNSGDILAADDVTERMFKAMGNGKWEFGNGQLAIGNGQWEMGDEKWDMGNETNHQYPIANHQ